MGAQAASRHSDGRSWQPNARGPSPTARLRLMRRQVSSTTARPPIGPGPGAGLAVMRCGRPLLRFARSVPASRAGSQGDWGLGRDVGGRGRLYRSVVEDTVPYALSCRRIDLQPSRASADALQLYASSTRATCQWHTVNSILLPLQSRSICRARVGSTAGIHRSTPKRSVLTASSDVIYISG